MKMVEEIPATMPAPCGMDCWVCYAHLKKKRPCLGCRGQDDAKPEHCRKCEIKTCALEQGLDFCFSCSTFPCTKINRLDKSYRQRYQTSLIDGAMRLKTVGAEQYLREEREKWLCADCGGAVSLHGRTCSECGKGW